jgi:hypothetical protein
MKKPVQRLYAASYITRKEQKTVKGGALIGNAVCIFDCKVYWTMTDCRAYCRNGRCMSGTICP